MDYTVLYERERKAAGPHIRHHLRLTRESHQPHGVLVVLASLPGLLLLLFLLLLVHRLPRGLKCIKERRVPFASQLFS